ncbi:MAG: sulfatase-like hydrolase/transferase [Gammaproteobacteria bacterium]|nr:sulfatase-like hydrolase/transferase [Gammaproteobacteria bacterium]
MSKRPNFVFFMTGRMPSVHGLRYNGCVLPQNANTFVDVLAADGYRTASFGKSHLQPFLDKPRFPSGNNVNGLIPEAWKELAGEYQQEEPGTYAGDQHYAFKTPYYGFREVDMVTLHGDRCGGHYQQWFKQNAGNWEDLHNPENELPHDYICPQAYRTPIPEALYPTNYIAERAIHYLNAQVDSDAPFFTYISFPDPHHPFNPPGKYWDMYSPDDFPVDLPFSDHKNPTPVMQLLKENYHNGGAQLTPQMMMYQGDREIQEARALTAGMISCVDDAVGNVLDALRANGQFDDTVICFSSDHGDYLGDFNLLLKGSLPFRGITRVPFIWSDPDNRTGTVSNALTSTIDIAATVCQRAGLEPYNGMQGLSLMPSMQKDVGVRDSLLIEFNESSPRLCFTRPARVRSLVIQQWRYTIYGGLEWGELYHLADDPHESNNLWDDPDYRLIRGELAELLCHQLTAQMDESPESVRLA